MAHHLDPISELRRICTFTSRLKEGDRRRALRWHLLRALFQSADLREHVARVEGELAVLREERTNRAWIHEEHVTELEDKLASRRNEVECLRADLEEADALVVQLEEKCDALFQTLEQAVHDDSIPATLPSNPHLEPSS